MIYREFRNVVLVPNKNWSEKDSLLGVLLRLENYVNINENTFKITKVSIYIYI